MLNAILARMLPRDAWGAFLRAFGLALPAGLLIVFVVVPILGVGTSFGGRVHDGYLELGASLARGHGYVFEAGGPPCTHRPPLTPVLLAPITRLPLPWQRSAMILMHSLMLGATCFMLFELARKAFDARVAAWSVGLMLAYPWLYWHVKNPMSMITQLTCTMLVVSLIGNELLESHKQGSGPLSRHWLLRAGLLGLAAGAAILTHGTMLLTVPLLLFGLVVIGLTYHRRRLAGVAVVAGIVAVLVVAPWSYRTSKVCHRFVPVVTGAGLQYFYGNALWGFDGRFTWQDRWDRTLVLAGVHEGSTPLLHFWGWKDPELDRQVNQRMIEDIKSDPARFARKVALNAIELYIPLIRDFVTPTGTVRIVVRHSALSLWHGAYWGLAILAVWELRRLRPRLCLILACIFALSVFYLPFVAAIRHSGYVLQTLPWLSVLASLGLLRKSVGADTASRSESGQDATFPGAPHFRPERSDEESPGLDKALLPVAVD